MKAALLHEDNSTAEMAPAPAGRPIQDLDDPPLTPGTEVGSYRIVRLLGAGGMGRVYLAEHRVIKRQAALKVLRRSLIDSPRAVERFFAEAEAVNRIHHPAIVEITDLFMDHDTPCIVMEHLEGRTLADEIKRGALDPSRVIALGREIAAALGATHAAGVIHRDLKPDNIFLATQADGSSCVKILDFGVAKLADAVPGAAGRTAVGSILGTPEYMAPEQLAGKEVDERVDVYALGVTLFHACAGHAPFSGTSFGDLVVKHLTQPPPLLQAPDSAVPPGLERAISAMLEKEATQRPRSMHEVDQLLAEALSWRPPRGAPRRIALAAIGLVIAVVAAWSASAFLRAKPAPELLAPAAVLEPATAPVHADAAPAAAGSVDAKPNGLEESPPPPGPAAAKKAGAKKRSTKTKPLDKRAVLDPFEGG